MGRREHTKVKIREFLTKTHPERNNLKDDQNVLTTTTDVAVQLAEYIGGEFSVQITSTDLIANTDGTINGITSYVESQMTA